MSSQFNPVFEPDGTVKRKLTASRQGFYRLAREGPKDRHLCKGCRSINFRTIFAANSAKLQLMVGRRPRDCTLEGIGVPLLGLPGCWLTPPSSCPLCELFAAMAIGETPSPDRLLHVRACGYSSLQNKAPNVPSSSDSSVVLALGEGPHDRFIRRLSNEELARGLLRVIPRQHQLSGIKATLDALVPGLPTRQIRATLETCCQHHTKYQQGRTQYPKGARAIDCNIRTVVPLTKGMRYLALSYVWGRPKSQNKRIGNNTRAKDLVLPVKLPQTIKDAMETCISLGFHYL